MHWLDQYYSRGRVGDPKVDPFKIDYTPGYNPDKDKIKVKTITPATESALPVPEAVKDKVVAESGQLKKPELTGYDKNVWDALSRAGFSGQILMFVYVLCYMESGGWTNGPATRDNNPGNIMYYKGGVKGTYIAANKTYANHFTTLYAFAVKLQQLMARGSRPIEAKTMEDFAHRLKLNNYYGKESELSYLNKLMATAKKLGMVGSYKEVMDKVRKKMDGEGDSWFKKHPIWTGVILTATGLFVIKVVTK